jgi:hypothetical protein
LPELPTRPSNVCKESSFPAARRLSEKGRFYLQRLFEAVDEVPDQH